MTKPQRSLILHPVQTTTLIFWALTIIFNHNPMLLSQCMMAQDQEHQPWDTQVMVMAGLILVLGHYPPCTTTYTVAPHLTYQWRYSWKLLSLYLPLYSSPQYLLYQKYQKRQYPNTVNPSFQLLLKTPADQSSSWTQPRWRSTHHPLCPSHVGTITHNSITLLLLKLW